MAEMPAGIVTFLFTDIEGSVRLWERQPDSMGRLLDHHNAILHAAIDKHRGFVFKEWGDQFCAVFAEASDAAEAAVDAQNALYEEVPQVRVRMALHTGAAELIKGDYFGPALGHVARLLSAGHGGQVLVSQATAELLDSEVPSDSSLHLLGTHRLRDIPESETIFHLSIEGLPNEFPPLNTLNVAFRRGMMRALALSSIVLTVMLGLLLSALSQRHRANRNAGLAAANYRSAIRQLALNQTEQGVQQLEEGNGLGLLNLVQARETAEPLPDLKDSIASVWAGWHQAYVGRLIGLVGHDRAVQDARFSPDGRLLATASEDKTVRLWDTRTWDLAAPPLQHDAPVGVVTFSPSGKLLASAAGSRVWLWDTATGTLRCPPLQHHDRVAAVAFRADGKLLASANWDGTIRLWDVRTGRERGQPLRQRDRIVHIGFGPQPENLLVSANEENVTIWSSTGGRVPIDLGRAPMHPDLTFDREGAVRAIALGGAVWLWNVADGQFRAAPRLQSTPINCLARSPDGSLLAEAGWNEFVVNIQAAATGARAAPPLVLPTGVNGLAFGPPGSRLLVTLSRGIVHLWDTTTGQAYPEPSPALGGVSTIAASPDGRTLACVAANGTVHLWSLSVRFLLRRFPFRSAGACVAFRADSELAICSSDGLQTYSADTGRLIGSLRMDPGKRADSFSEDGRFLLTWKGQSLSVWPTQPGQNRRLSLHFPQQIHYAVLSSHGTVLATVSRPDTVRLWDVPTGRSRGEPLRQPSAAGKMEFSPDEGLLATAGSDGVWLWDTVTGHLHVPPLRLTGSPRNLTFAPNGALLAITTWYGGAVTLWNTATGRPFLHPLEHSAPVIRAVFSPDGKRLATVTEENTVYLWDLVKGQPVGHIMTHPDEVQDLSFSPDGKRLATASLHGARLWDVTTGQLAGSALLSREPVWEVKFGPEGRVLALRADRSVCLWRLPSSRADMRTMKLLTSVSLGIVPGDNGTAEPFPEREWRRAHQKTERPE